MGIPRHQWLRVIAFVLEGAAHSWFVSNLEHFRSYEDFCNLFLRYNHSDSATCAKLARLRSTPFNPKINRSVEGFIIDRYNAIRDLDPHVSEIQVCHSLISLLPISYQKHLAASRITDLTEILETVRRLEAIFEVYENRPYPSTNQHSGGRGKDYPVKMQGMKQVQTQNSLQPNVKIRHTPIMNRCRRWYHQILLRRVHQTMVGKMTIKEIRSLSH